MISERKPVSECPCSDQTATASPNADTLACSAHITHSLGGNKGDTHIYGNKGNKGDTHIC